MGEAYTVLTIDQLSRMSDTRGIEPYFRLNILTKGGVRRTLDLSEAEYSDEKKVAAILLKEAQHTDAILGL